jgi:SAM-dependent methyltransferase
MSLYNDEFYANRVDGTLNSAKVIIPIIISLIKPKSVVDVGCGTGEWLATFKEHGVTDILGIDGDYVDRQKLKISEHEFLPFDLRKPLRLNKEFNLVISVEVAEHLPIECAEAFVESLTLSGPVILFSAAIPFQGGLNHLNEQWPDYWHELFKKHNYTIVDCVRKQIWNNRDVAYYYAQNIFIYIKKEMLDNFPALVKGAYVNNDNNMLSIVHPSLYLQRADIRNCPSLKAVLLNLPALCFRSLKGRVLKLAK